MSGPVLGLIGEVDLPNHAGRRLWTACPARDDDKCLGVVSGWSGCVQSGRVMSRRDDQGGCSVVESGVVCMSLRMAGVID